ncbi:MAG: response regulator [Cyanothece sp. SIO1E1]|nr:response regulator [Cyanothece sp. SIO1E1]
MFFKRKTHPLIYILEDSKSYQILLRVLLEKKGFKTKVFECASLAKDQLLKDKPSLVLSDINMPNSNGLDFCLQVNSELCETFIPFIFISSDDSYENCRKAEMLTNQSLIKKPMETRLVLKAIDNVLSKRRLLLN